ncbi:hypothetical protein GCM10020360_26860 [Nonlabens tegetincola]
MQRRGRSALVFVRDKDGLGAVTNEEPRGDELRDPHGVVSAVSRSARRREHRAVAHLVARLPVGPAAPMGRCGVRAQLGEAAPDRVGPLPGWVERRERARRRPPKRQEPRTEFVAGADRASQRGDARRWLYRELAHIVEQRFEPGGELRDVHG